MTMKREQLVLARKLVTKCEDEAKQLISLQAEAQVGGLVQRTIREKIDAIDMQHESLLRECEILVATIESEALTSADIEVALRFRESVLKGFNEATFQDKRRMLEALRVKITISGKTAKIECCIPLSDCQFDVASSRR